VVLPNASLLLPFLRPSIALVRQKGQKLFGIRIDSLRRELNVVENIIHLGTAFVVSVGRLCVAEQGSDLPF
jgi:hypothetical protein